MILIPGVAIRNLLSIFSWIILHFQVIRRFRVPLTHHRLQTNIHAIITDYITEAHNHVIITTIIT